MSAPRISPCPASDDSIQEAIAASLTGFESLVPSTSVPSPTLTLRLAAYNLDFDIDPETADLVTGSVLRFFEALASPKYCTIENRLDVSADKIAAAGKRQWPGFLFLHKELNVEEALQKMFTRLGLTPTITQLTNAFVALVNGCIFSPGSEAPKLSTKISKAYNPGFEIDALKCDLRARIGTIFASFASAAENKFTITDKSVSDVLFKGCTLDKAISARRNEYLAERRTTWALDAAMIEAEDQACLNAEATKTQVECIQQEDEFGDDVSSHGEDDHESSSGWQHFEPTVPQANQPEGLAQTDAPEISVSEPTVLQAIQPEVLAQQEVSEPEESIDERQSVDGTGMKRERRGPKAQKSPKSPKPANQIDPNDISPKAAAFAIRGVLEQLSMIRTFTIDDLTKMVAPLGDAAKMEKLVNDALKKYDPTHSKESKSAKGQPGPSHSEKPKSDDQHPRPRHFRKGANPKDTTKLPVSNGQTSAE
jgi:hypothetical protein